MGVQADRLIARLDRAGARQWPPRWIAEPWDYVSRMAAFRDNDRDRLKQLAGWEPDDERRYMIDPLPEKVSTSFANLLFRSPPRITPADPGDADRLGECLDETDYPSGLRRAALDCSAEGEIWWRIRADATVSEHPLVEWYSRAAVVALFAGIKPLAVAFISRLDPLTVDEDPDRDGAVVHRRFEVYDATDVVNVLYEGQRNRLGDRVDLGRHPDAEDAVEEWRHELPRMPSGRILNKDPKPGTTWGVSDYDGIEDFFLELNECMDTGRSNRELTARKRVIVPPSALDEAGNLPARQEVIVAESNEDTTIGAGGGGGARQYGVLEYTFDAEALTAYKRDMVTTALARVGIAAQWAGVPSEDGYASSGTALRLRLIPTTNEGDGKGQFFDDQGPKQLELVQLLDARPAGEPGGFGVAGWVKPDEPPAWERVDGVPADVVEETDVHTRRVEARIESRKQAIRELHPDWTDQQVDDELKLIDDDAPEPSTGSGGSLFDGIIPRRNGDRPTQDDEGTDDEATGGEDGQPIGAAAAEAG